jgi:hypothetical protein
MSRISRSGGTFGAYVFCGAINLAGKLDQGIIIEVVWLRGCVTKPYKTSKAPDGQGPLLNQL